MTQDAMDAETQGTIRVVELQGISGTSWGDASLQAVERARRALRHFAGLRILRSTPIRAKAVVHNGKIAEYHVKVEVEFVAQE